MLASLDDQQIAIERIVGAPLEAALLGIGLKQPMDGLRLHAGLPGHALGSASRRRGKQDIRTLGRKDFQDGVEQGGLADAGIAGHDHHLGFQHHGDRLPLPRCKGLPGLLLDPLHGDRGVDLRPRRRSAAQGKQPGGDALFSNMQARRKMQSVPSMT